MYAALRLPLAALRCSCVEGMEWLDEVMQGGKVMRDKRVKGMGRRPSKEDEYSGLESRVQLMNWGTEAVVQNLDCSFVSLTPAQVECCFALIATSYVVRRIGPDMSRLCWLGMLLSLCTLRSAGGPGSINGTSARCYLIDCVKRRHHLRRTPRSPDVLVQSTHTSACRA